MPKRFEGHALPAYFYAFPGEAVGAVGFILGGVSVIVDTMDIPGLRIVPQPSNLNEHIQGNWDYYLFAVGIASLIAGAATIIGLARWRADQSTSGIEQLGLWLTSGVCLSYSILSVLVAREYAIIPIIALAGFGVSSIIRSRAILILQRSFQEQMAVTNELIEEVSKHVPPDPGTPESPRPDHPGG